MLVLLDTNVLLDSILQRAPWHNDADAILQAGQQGKLVCAATTHALATVFYVARKVVGNATARTAVRNGISSLTILPVDKQTLVDADALPGVDFEDNILIAAAVAGAVNVIVTRNVADFSHSPVPVCDPPELLQRLPGGSPPAATGEP